MNMDYGAWTWPSWLSLDGGFGPKFLQAHPKFEVAGTKVAGWFGEDSDVGGYLVGAGTAIIGGIQQKRAMERQAALQVQLAAQQMEVDAQRAARTQQLLMIGIPTIAIVIGVIAWSRKK